MTLSRGRQSLLWKLVCVVLWAAEELVAGALIERYSAFQVIWVRFAAQLLLMFALWGGSQPSGLWRTTRPALQFARAALMVAMPVCWLLAQREGLALPRQCFAMFPLDEH